MMQRLRELFRPAAAAGRIRRSRIETGRRSDHAARFAAVALVALLLVVRGAPVLLYRRELAGRERGLLALFSATTLPLVVVIAELGKATGRMMPENAATLVGAGILSVLVFPLIALSVRGERPRSALRASA
jgi:hypothetical protein